MSRYRWSAVVSMVMAIAVVGALTASEWAGAQTGSTLPEPTPVPTAAPTPDVAGTVTAEIAAFAEREAVMNAEILARLSQNRSRSEVILDTLLKLEVLPGVDHTTQLAAIAQTLEVDREIETQNTEQIITAIAGIETTDVAATAIAQWQEALLTVTPVAGSGSGIEICSQCRS